MKTKQTLVKADHENFTDVYKRAKKYMIEDNIIYVNIDYDGVIFELSIIDNENTAYINYKKAYESSKHDKAHYIIIIDNSAVSKLDNDTDLNEAITELQRLSLKEKKPGIIYKSVVLSKIDIITEKIN